MNRWFLLTIILILSGISLIFINSLVPELTAKHFLSICLGLLAFFIVTRIPVQQIFERPWQIYVIACLLLVVPLVLPTKIRGTARWIPVVGSFRLQPSQLAFVLVGISLSSLTYRFYQKGKQKSIVTTTKQLAVVALPTILIAIEPDLGTAVFFLFCMSLLIFFAGMPTKHVAALLGTGVFLSYFAWLFLLQPYQRQRITTFLQPQEASQNETYNVRQSLIAIGAGGLSGSGFGEGSQSQLRFLPEKHTDFVFASFSEEFGFLGSASLVILYLLLGLYLLKESYSIQSQPQRFFVFFVACYVFFQSVINISTNTGLIPVTGMTLPFFSYGGTSFLTFGLALGLAQNCAQQEKRHPLLHIV